MNADNHKTTSQTIVSSAFICLHRRPEYAQSRALVQGGDLILLDEAAALNPENLRQALECLLRRAETLSAVANP
jgi:hypothetical protein